MYNLQMFSPTFNYGFKIILWIVIYIIVNEWGIMNLTFHQNTPHENVSFHPPSKPIYIWFPHPLYIDVNCLSGKGLLSRIYKEHIYKALVEELYKKKNNLIKIWEKDEQKRSQRKHRND